MHIRSLLFVVSMLGYGTKAGERNGLTVGARERADELLEERQEMVHGSPDYTFSYARTYVGSNLHLVTQLLVDDLGHGATVALVAGGPGCTFVTLSFTILRHSEMHFKVSVYGKLPPFRKVV